jgi:glucose/arabinose dehydrogenase
MRPARRTAAPAAAAALMALAAAGPAAAAITAPPGVRVQTVAVGIPNLTAVAFDARGGMWTTSAAVAGGPGDGVWYTPRPRARPRQVVGGLTLALGLAWRDGVLYVTHVSPRGHSPAAVAARTGSLTAYRGFDGRRFRASRPVLRNLPVGRHTVDAVVVGPDRRLYVGVGSRYDARAAAPRLSATVLSVDPDTRRGPRVEARGLRNPYGLAFIPGTADLLVTDNGRDDLGPSRPPDEVNLVRTAGPARHFGFPRCWGQGGPPCRGTVPALVRTAPHASTDGIAVADGTTGFGRSAFIADNGSSLFDRPVTWGVRRVVLRRAGGTWRGTLRPFASGFRRFDPLGLAMGPGGALYATLYVSGRVIRFVPPPRAAGVR